ncbi:MAG: signal peptidase I [Clostridiales bacterium]|jgi:signal peptidase|nr:signal peptidase I [Clostridiales bacterium]
MAKPLNELNTEFEITRNRPDGISIRIPQEKYSEFYQQAARDLPLSQPDSTASEYLHPDPAAIASRFTLPQLDPVMPKYTPPRSDPVMPKYTLPQSDPVMPKYTPSQPDFIIPYTPQPDSMPKYTPQPDSMASKYTPPKPDTFIPYILPEPDPLTSKYTPRRPDTLTPEYMPQEPDPIIPKYTPPEPDPIMPKYTPPESDSLKPKYTPPQSDYITTGTSGSSLRQAHEPLASPKFESVKPKFSPIPISNYSAERGSAPRGNDHVLPPSPRDYNMELAAPHERAVTVPADLEPKSIETDIGERLRKAAARRKEVPEPENEKSRLTVSPSSVETVRPPKKWQIKTAETKAKNKKQYKSENPVKNTIADVLFYSVLISLIIGALYWGKGSGKPINIFGYSVMNVLSTSMQDTIPKGSLIITKEVPINELKVGDDISYFMNANSVNTHRIIQVFPDYNDTGQIAFQTKGTNSQSPDHAAVYGEQLVGRVIFHIPRLGDMLTFVPDLITNPSNLLWVILVFISLIVFSFSLRGLFSSFKEESATWKKTLRKKKRRYT